MLGETGPPAQSTARAPYGSDVSVALLLSASESAAAPAASIQAAACDLTTLSAQFGRRHRRRRRRRRCCRRHCGGGGPRGTTSRKRGPLSAHAGRHRHGALLARRPTAAAEIHKVESRGRGRTRCPPGVSGLLRTLNQGVLLLLLGLLN